MTTGRNDPCPCGSGRKYKKCCLDKTATAAQTTAPSATTSPAAEAEPRFYPAVTTYCTQAALAEALKPGGMVHIHPYVLIKLRDDPRLMSSLGPSQRAALLRVWRASKLSVMETDAIEMNLNDLGIPYEPSRFEELSRNHDSAWYMAEEWANGLPAVSEADREFIGLAACELWRRRLPQHPSLEMIDDWICEGYAYSDRKDPAAALAAWWKAWEAIRPRLTSAMKSMQEAGEQLFPHMSQRLENWCVDFRLEALNGALKDQQCGEVGIRFSEEVFARFAAEDENLDLSGDLATLYFAVGRPEEAGRICQELIRTHPDRARGYVTLADESLMDYRKGSASQEHLRRSIQLLEQALAYPVKDAEDFDLQDRLARARESLSKASGADT